MRRTHVLLAISLLLAGCARPVNGVAESPTGETILGKGGLNGVVGKPGAGVIAAGGGNVIAAGGGNVIAAGGGNAIAPQAAAKAGGNLSASSNVVAAGGGNLIVTSSSGVIAAGGMNLSAGKSLDPANGSEAAPGGSFGVGAIAGKVVVPGALVGRSAASVAVPQTYVGVYDMAGRPVGDPVATDADGRFRLDGVPAFQMLSLRTVFTYKTHAYYLSSLVRLEASEVLADVSPVSTLAEAAYFTNAKGVLPKATLIGEPYLQAFLAGLGAWNGEVSAEALAAGAPLAKRATAYAALKAAHPGAFTNDIDAAFDQTATVDPTGLEVGVMPGEAPSAL